MLFFVISFILIFSSSYFLASIFDRHSEKGIVYLFLIAFAQIILTTEILSLFTQIKEVPFLCANLTFWTISFLVWKKLKSPKWSIDLKPFFNKFKNLLKLDKSLIILLICWICFLIISLFFIIVLPATNADARIYHVVRSFYYVLNHSLAHFETANIRTLVSPINSEILYTWIILFTKKQLCFGIFSFLGYLLTCLSSFKIMRFLGYSMRKCLWVLFIFSSFASVIILSVETETDLIIAGLITLSIYLFLESLKTNSNKTIYMSSLAYSIALGVKTTAILITPAFAFILLMFSLKYKNTKTIIKFLSFTFANFILFSSYNYIQNYLNYGNFLGTTSNNYMHKNIWGLKGTLASLIKYLRMFFDFSGTTLNKIVVPAVAVIFLKINSIFHVQTMPDGNYSAPIFVFNSTLLGIHAGCGILSFLLILPCWLSSLCAPLFLRRKKLFSICIFGVALAINLLSFSYFLTFMTFNIRFFTTMILMSSPILLYSYFKSNKNILKLIYVAIACFYLIFITSKAYIRPLNTILSSIKNYGVMQTRSNYSCPKNKNLKSLSDECKINYLLEAHFNNPKYKILFFNSQTTEIIYGLVKNLKGYHYEFRNMENLNTIKPEDFDVIIYPIYGQYVSAFNQKYVKANNLIKNSDTNCYYLSKDNNVLTQNTISKNNIAQEQVCLLKFSFTQKHNFVKILETRHYSVLLNANTLKELR